MCFWPICLGCLEFLPFKDGFITWIKQEVPQTALATASGSNQQNSHGIGLVYRERDNTICMEQDMGVNVLEKSDWMA